MKVIDLLNKIANGEEIPKKIRWGCHNLEWFVYDYKALDELGEPTLSELCGGLSEYILNEELEIIEENNKIKYVGKEYDLTKFYNDYKEPAILLRDMSNKIKEIIDKINEMSNGQN